jgi:hypothetical protein
MAHSFGPSEWSCSSSSSPAWRMSVNIDLGVGESRTWYSVGRRTGALERRLSQSCPSLLFVCQVFGFSSEPRLFGSFQNGIEGTETEISP